LELKIREDHGKRGRFSCIPLTYAIVAYLFIFTLSSSALSLRITRDNILLMRLRPCGAGTKRSAGIFCRAPPLFWLYTSTISHFGERFRDGQYSLVSFLFVVLLTVSPCPAICNSGGCALWNRRQAYLACKSAMFRDVASLMT